jgi:hypothetical protein
MPRVRNMDRSAGVSSQERWIAPPSLPVREHAQVQHGGTDRPWPFLYSYREGRCIVNAAPRKSAYANADIGEALM